MRGEEAKDFLKKEGINKGSGDSSMCESEQNFLADEVVEKERFYFQIGK